MSVSSRLLCASVAFAMGSTLLAGRAFGQHKWYQGGKDRGFQQNIPDFFQHQFYEGDIANTWETYYPDKTTYPKWGELGGLCYQTAISNAVASWQPYGYAGITAAGTLTNNTWRTAYKTTIENVQAGFVQAGGFQKYLDDAKTANGWKRRLLFNQYTMETDAAGDQTGTVLTPSGKKIQEPDGTGGFKPSTVFDVYKRMMLNEASVTLVVTKDPAETYSDTLWWGNYHAVTGAGFDGKTGTIYYADPDSNKGSRSAKAGYEIGSAASADAGDGGWVFHSQVRGEADPRKRFTWVDPVGGAEVADVKDNKKFTYVHLADDGMGGVKVEKTDIDGAGGPEAVMGKGADANITARKYGAGDVAPPVPGRPKAASDPTNYNKFYGAMKVDNSSPADAFKVTASDDFTNGITNKGRYTGVNISAMDVIHPAGFNELAKVNDGTGVKSDIKLASITSMPVDRIQLCSVNTAAQYDATIDGSSFLDSDGGIWKASFIDPASSMALDAMGNSLFGKGGWEFTLLSGDGLAPFDRDNLTDTTLDAAVRTTSDLVQFDLLEHAMLVSAIDDDGEPFTAGDYWTIQSYGFGSIDRGLQVAADPPVPAPGAAAIGLLGLGAMPRRRRR